MYAGPMFRAERPQKGRQREFNQVGVECLGAESPTIDAEAIIMLMQFYAEVGIPRESMVLLINSMGCEKCRPAYRELVREYMDTQSDRLCDTCRGRMEINPLRAFDCKNADCKDVMAGAPKITEHLCDDCREHYKQVCALLRGAGIEYTESAELVRGLDYYTRTVFEVQVTDGMGSQNAIGGGGRYDKLAAEVGGRDTPGFGFALGFERCALALEAAGVVAEEPSVCDLFVACAGEELRGQVFEIAQAARTVGIRAEIDHQSRSLKSQFKLADKLGAKHVAILGADEAAAGVIKLRDMATREESLVTTEEMIARLK
jgi:histidyl-tRNA synthetase